MEQQPKAQQSEPQQPEPQQQPEPDDDAPAPNRRERRGAKPGVQAQHSGKFGSGHRSAPSANRRQYSTRRRGG